MGRKFSRRKFLIHASAATAAACAKDSLAITGKPLAESPLPSTLSPRVRHGLVDVARNRRAYQSSAADDDHTAHLATDGSGATYWEPQPGGEQWITVDLAEVVPVQRVTIVWGDVYARSYRIEVSVDSGSSPRWTTVFQTSQGHGQSIYRMSPAVRAKHIRVTGTSAAPDRGFVVRALEAWSSVEPARKSNPKQTVSGRESLIAGWSLQSAQFTQALPQDIASPHYFGSN